MPENKVQITLEAIDKTQAALKQFDTNATSVISKIKSHWLELTAAGASIYGLIKGLTAFVNEAAKAEQIESRMAFQIETVGIKYAKVKETIDGFADSLRGTTRFSDEAGREGLGKMMQYTADLEAAMNGLKLAMDMSTQTGQDLDSTIRYIGMAMNGNVEILGRWIPELGDLDTKLGENATNAEKAAYAFDILNKKFSGAAEKDLKTYQGSLEKMKNELREIEETIGAKLMPYWDMWVAGVNSLIGKVNPLAEAQKKLKDGMKAVSEESKKAVAAKQWEDFLTALRNFGTGKETENVTKHISELDNAFEQLGATSQITLIGNAQAAKLYVDRIKEAFKSGKASVDDYKKALEGASAIFKQLTGEDKTKQLFDLQVETQKKMEAVSREDPERQKRINEIIEESIKRRTEIEGKSLAKLEADYREHYARVLQITDEFAAQTQAQIAEKPLILETKTDQVKKAWDKIYDYYAQLKQKIESNPIEATIKVNTESSPKMPFSEGMDYIMKKFGSLQNAISGLEATIRFKEFSAEIRAAEKEMEKYNKVLLNWTQLNTLAGGAAANSILRGFDPHEREKLFSLMEGVQDRLDILKMKQQMEQLKMLEGSFQTGMPYVPKTGLYMLHKGEEVRTTNQVSMGGVVINVKIPGAGDPREVAEQLVKVFKYRLKGELKDLIS